MAHEGLLTGLTKEGDLAARFVFLVGSIRTHPFPKDPYQGDLDDPMRGVVDWVNQNPEQAREYLLQVRAYAEGIIRLLDSDLDEGDEDSGRLH